LKYELIRKYKCQTKKRPQTYSQRAGNPPNHVEKGPSSVKDIHAALGGDTSNGYTTILKLFANNASKRSGDTPKGREITSLQSRGISGNTNQQLVHKMIETVFDGSASQHFVLSALGNHKSSKED